MGDRILFITLFCVVLSVMSFSTTTRGDAVKNLIILREFLLLLLPSLSFRLAPPPFCVLLPPLGAPAAPALSLGGILWMYPATLRWTFGVLYAAIAFCLPRLSVRNVLVLFLLVWECDVVAGGFGVVGVRDCQNDSIVG